MSDKARTFLGPELIWAVLIVAALLLGASNKPPTIPRNQQLELVAFILPLAGVTLSFLPFIWNKRGKWWCLARVFAASAIGICATITTLCGAISYGDSRDSGVGTGWMLFISLAFCLLLIGVGIAALVLLVRRLTQRG